MQCLGLCERLFDCSSAAFRRRWDTILKSLKIPKDPGLTPGGVRGGGCVYAFQNGMSLPMLLWRMRIKHLQALESYLQEVVASTVVSELPVEARQSVSSAAALAPFLPRSLQVANPKLSRVECLCELRWARSRDGWSNFNFQLFLLQPPFWFISM